MLAAAKVVRHRSQSIACGEAGLSGLLATLAAPPDRGREVEPSLDLPAMGARIAERKILNRSIRATCLVTRPFALGNLGSLGAIAVPAVGAEGRAAGAISSAPRRQT